MNLTLLTCNYNTDDLVINLLKSVKQTCAELPQVLVANTSKSHEPGLLDDNGIPYFNYRNGIHGEAVNLALRKIQTRYVLLVDSDVIFFQDFKKPFEKFKESGCALMGKVVGDCGGKALYERVEPWYCFIDLYQLKQHKIDFFDREKTKDSKNGKYPKIFDIGSTMFMDVTNRGMTVGDVNLEGKYFKHYGGMSWRVQTYDPTQEDTDIDFGGTHPNKVLYDIGMQIRQQYEQETISLKDINIKGAFSNESGLY